LPVPSVVVLPIRVRYTGARDCAMPPDADGEGRSNDDAQASKKDAR